MKVVDKLASSLGRRDEVPNQELAAEIAATNDKKAVAEVVLLLGNKSKDIQSDCIKVIYEIGELKPGLIAPHYADLLGLLHSKNNRLQWGAMTALKTLAAEMPESIFKDLPRLLSAAEAGSVITMDGMMAILIKLAGIPKYANDALAIFNEQLLRSPTNQLPMYAENVLPVINDGSKAMFSKTLSSRLDEIEKEPKRKRVEKVIKKLQPK